MLRNAFIGVRHLASQNDLVTDCEKFTECKFVGKVHPEEDASQAQEGSNTPWDLSE